MSKATLSEKPAKLPVWRGIVWSYDRVFTNLGYLLRISWLWLLIMVPLSIAVDVSNEAARKAGVLSETNSFAVSLLLPLLTVPYFASIAFAWLRFLLIGERYSSIAYLRFDWPVVRLIPICLLGSSYYLAWAFLTELPWQLLWFWLKVAFNLGMPIFVLTFVIAMTGLIVIPILVSFRLVTAVSAMAIRPGEKAVARSWQATRGNFWRIIFGMLGVSPIFFICTVIPLILTEIFGGDGAPSWSNPMSYIDAMGQLVLSWFTLAFIAFCGKHFRIAVDDSMQRSSESQFRECAPAPAPSE